MGNRSWDHLIYSPHKNTFNTERIEKINSGPYIKILFSWKNLDLWSLIVLKRSIIFCSFKNHS